MFSSNQKWNSKNNKIDLDKFNNLNKRNKNNKNNTFNSKWKYQNNNKTRNLKKTKRIFMSM